MKKTLLLAVALTPFIGVSALSAQDSVTSDAAGFVKTTLADGYSLLGINLTKAPVHGAKVQSATSDTITVPDDGTDIGALLGAGSYYLELSGGAMEGDRIDIASASGNQITLDTASANSTLNDASGVPVDSTFLIREHYTFSDLGADIGEASLLGGTGPSNSDRILTFNGGFQIHFYGSDGEWYAASGFANVSDKPIAPGSGVLFYANPQAGARDLELLVTGSVRDNDVVRPLDAGFQVVSTGFPIDLSPADLVMTTQFFQGGTSPTNADRILTFDGGFKVHFLGEDDNWYAASGFANVTDVDLFADQGAVLVYRNNPDSGFLITNKFEEAQQVQ